MIGNYRNCDEPQPNPVFGTYTMPRKRWRTRLRSYDVPANDIDPKVPVPAKDDEIVRHALVDFDELSVLSRKIKEQLVADLVDALRFARARVNAGRRGVSDEALAQQIFLSDVGRALERAGLPAKRWRKRYDDGDGPSNDAPESLFFRLAREVADVAGMVLPRDLKLPGKRAAKHQYGMMSPAMKAAQEAQLETEQQCGADLKLIMAQLEFARRQPASAKKIRPKLVPGPIPKAIADRTRAEMEMGKQMNVYHASRQPVPRKQKS